MTQTNKRAYAPPRQGAGRRAHPAAGGQTRRPAAAPGGQPRRAQTAATGGGNRRPAAPRRSRPFGDALKIAIFGLIAAVLAYGLQCAWPSGFPLVERGDGDVPAAASAVTEIYSSGPVRINEIMSGNRRTFVDADGNSPDWIEVANVGGSEVNLKGYTLAKDPSGANAFTFPELRLAPGECALVLADSRLRADAAEALHAPFRLSSAGDALMLFNAGGTAIDTVNVPALSADQSYVRVDVAQWQQCSTPTPGLPNTEEGYRALTEPAGDSPVVVTELMSTNTSTLADENGQYYDYIELCNRSGESVNLGGWHLSDDVASPRKWSFPEVELAPGEYLVVYASKLDRREDAAHLHTNFALSSEGEQVVLSNTQGRVMDRVDFGLLKANVAWSLAADGSWSSALAPSPGRAND